MNPKNEELILTFFVLFSRFEYALKASGSFRILRDDVAGADWCIVEKAIREAESDQMERIRRNAGILLTNPPKLQVISEGKLDWRVAGSSGDDAQNIIASIKRVRNNLFHGGKYSSKGEHLSPRSFQLMQCSIAVLKELLELPQLYRVAHYYREYEIEEG